MELIPGHLLSTSQRREVLAAFVFRNTIENPGGAKITGETLPPVSDEEWLSKHAFYFRKDGRLANRPKYCEPYYPDIKIIDTGQKTVV